MGFKGLFMGRVSEIPRAKLYENRDLHFNWIPEFEGT